MGRHTLLVGGAIAVVILLTRTSPGLAQYRAPDLQRPTLSPYLDLLRPDFGPLPNYYQYVRPREQARQTLERQDRALQRQDRSIQQQRLQLRALEAPASQSGRGALAPRRTAATFMFYSHYYPRLTTLPSSRR